MHTFQRNRLLASLPADARNRLLAHCEPVALPLRTVLFAPHLTPEYAYFILTGIACVATSMTDGATAEVEIIGSEGLVGCFHLLGHAPVPTRCQVQIAGTCLRIRLDQLRNLFHSSQAIRARILELVQCQSFTINQIAGCNRLHQTGARLARLLLMTQVRASTSVLDVTHQCLAQMLGTQRTTITSTAAGLQRSGLIRYTKGKLSIVHREGLEGAACECYPLLKKLHAGLYTLAAA